MCKILPEYLVPNYRAAANWHAKNSAIDSIHALQRAANIITLNTAQKNSSTFIHLLAALNTPRNGY